MIIIRAEHDIATKYLYDWCENILDDAQERGFTITKLDGDNISKDTLRGRIRNRQPSLIFFNGHGTTDTLYNNQKEEFITMDSSDVFNNTIVFARACDSLAELGPKAVENGCHAYMGYKRKFWLAFDDNHACTPLNDPVAKPIIEGSNVVMKELIKGKRVKEAIEKSHDYASKNIMDLIYSKEPLASASLAAIIYNDDALGFEGNGDASV